MGCALSTGDKDLLAATQRSSAIDERLAYESARRRNEIKLLLLGEYTSKAVKSCLLFCHRRFQVMFIKEFIVYCQYLDIPNSHTHKHIT